LWDRTTKSMSAAPWISDGSNFWKVVYIKIAWVG
jgi:hypothetical protein